MDIQKLWSNIKQILIVHNNRIQTKEDFFQELEKHQESDDQKTYFHFEYPHLESGNLIEAFFLKRKLGFF